ncbi:MAG: exonuclease SbcCD subunit D [Gemmataceae bacterium]
MASFLHAADLHLGMRITRFDPQTAGKIREARFTALDNILKKTRELRVDFVLIAGDLFDDAAVDNMTARRAFDILDSFPVPVFVLPGNHDPLQAGGVWEQSPWSQHPGKQVRLLTDKKPIEVAPGLALLPCPVFRKTCMDDPTEWILRSPPSNGCIRIGVAHGSLKTRDDLPLDDHLIARHATTDLRLDYLALGHWHSRQMFADPDGVERTAYPGVHEPMGFQGNGNCPTGWVAYGGPGRKEFLDTGSGEVLHVRIPVTGAVPQIETVEVGHFHWKVETKALASREDLEGLIQEVATRDAVERQLLRLNLSGVLDADSTLRLEELREVLKRYQLGALDETNLHVRPTPDELSEIAGQGVLSRVLERLQQEANFDEPGVRQVAERAILLLYQIAKGAKG